MLILVACVFYIYQFAWANSKLPIQPSPTSLWMQIFLMLKYTICFLRMSLWLKFSLIVPAFLNQDSSRKLSPTFQGHRLYIMNLLLASASRMVLVMKKPWKDGGNSPSKQFLSSVVQMRNLSWQRLVHKGSSVFEGCRGNFTFCGSSFSWGRRKVNGVIFLIFFGHYLGQYNTYGQSAISTGWTRFVRS